ncbi:HAD family hydrolase [Rhodoferax saidenbachensis]|uniref:HAD family hydrolase n=1 Tax=Rhodoferax saidenbachensis TaxID=1484693 RepID=A0A1P8K6Q3_9BURK|nr:HAD-IIB family hydrolase [Rhodoferax saidenbachensis]APW41695.1 HAD family hydrolase [Rhodoferax saidenbachensis]
MKPLASWPLQARRDLVGVFTDIDDTLTTEGTVTPAALQALADLKAAGLAVIPITGRHVGWCEPLMEGGATPPWPADAMVAENGALALVPNPGNSNQNGLQPAWNVRRQLSKLYQQDADTRATNQARMEQVAAQVLAQVPGALRARDEGGRETDLAFDYNEFTHLSPAAVQQTLAILQGAGMHTTVSSIHIHGCFGDFNKWLGACWIVRELFQRDLAQELGRWVFVGDSGNDQPMFEHFTHSVGVANIRRFESQLQHLPRYITPSERGAGFAEVTAAILEARKA